MYRIIIFSIQLIFLLLILSFVFTNPFIISLDIGNFKYSFPSNFFAFFVIIFLLVIYVTFYILFKSRLALNNYFLKNKYRKLEIGYQHFVDAMIAISNNDNRTATRSHKKMNKYLKDDPSLSLLLRSEVYKIEKKNDHLLEVYERMIKTKKTEVLGYKGLMELNLRQEDYHHAFLYGEKLFNINSNIEKLYDTLIYISAKTKNWNQMIILSDKAFSRKIIRKDVLAENKSIAHYEIAHIKSDSNIKDSIKNISKALELKKNFPPYIKLHLELVSKSKNLSLLKKLLKKYWLSSPNFLVRTIITKIIIENRLGQLGFINQIVKNNFNNEESKKLLIYFAIKNQEWTIARNNISGLIGANPSSEICLFMADIELGENNDKQTSDSWIKRAENSLSQNLWVCKNTNQSQEEWSSLSNSGYFNSLVLNNVKMVEFNKIKYDD